MSETHTDRTLLFHQAQPLNAFSERGADYASYRPGYPSAAIDAILEGLGNPSQLTAADIGAGTGIASRLLAERSVRVMAIEPNASMRQAAEFHPLVEFSDATAEATSLPEASIDLITSFQAFHWFNPIPTLAEFRRILKPSGRMALIWSTLDKDDEFSAQFDRLVNTSMNQQPTKPRGGLNQLLASSPHFTNVRRCRFTYKHELDSLGTIGYAQSKSFVPRAGLAHEQLISDLQKLHARWADKRGLVSFVHRTNVYLAEPRLQDLSRFRTLLQRLFLAK